MVEEKLHLLKRSSPDSTAIRVFMIVLKPITYRSDLSHAHDGRVVKLPFANITNVMTEQKFGCFK